MIRTLLITSDASLARDAEAAGISRIMVDMEYIGKKERQKTLSAHMGSHQKGDVAKLRAILKNSELVVRINPWHENSKSEIDYAVGEGADTIMLPMIEQLSQLEHFLETLGSRAKPLPLVETAYSMTHIDTIAANPAIDDIYIGLNDLHLSLNLDFLFEPLALGHIDTMAGTIKAAGKTFGFGGIAAIGGGELPAINILGEHARLGSSCVILSSQFKRDTKADEPAGRPERLKASVAALQQAHDRLLARKTAQIQEDREKTFAIIGKLAEKSRNAKKQAHAAS